MDRRDISFGDYADVAREIESLQRTGYRRGGSWTLGQICRHLSFYFRGSLEGFSFQFPWILRVTVGRWMLKSALAPGLKRAGSPTAPPSIPAAESDDAPGVEEALVLLRRLESNAEPLKPSGLYGELTNEQWKGLHLSHSAHHLSFLHPTA